MSFYLCSVWVEEWVAPMGIKEILNDVTAGEVATASEFIGASEDDIVGIERCLSVRLPTPYKAFLRVVGRGAGRFLRDDHWYFTIDALLELNANARPRLEAAGLRGQWFCFATRMGEADLYFLADGANDDPPVFVWTEETDPKIEKGFESFGHWLKSMVDDYKSWSFDGRA